MAGGAGTGGAADGTVISDSELSHGAGVLRHSVHAMLLLGTEGNTASVFCFRGCLKSPANSNFTESAIRLHPCCPEAGVTTYSMI